MLNIKRIQQMFVYIKHVKQTITALNMSDYYNIKHVKHIVAVLNMLKVLVLLIQ